MRLIECGEISWRLYKGWSYHCDGDSIAPAGLSHKLSTELHSVHFCSSAYAKMLKPVLAAAGILIQSTSLCVKHCFISEMIICLLLLNVFYLLSVIIK